MSRKLTEKEKRDLSEGLKEISEGTDEYPFKLITLKMMLNQYADCHLTPSYLQRAFLIIANPDDDGYSEEILMSDLVEYHPNFRTTNGSTWSRRDGSSFLAKKYKIKNEKKNSSIYSVKLDGLNERFRIDRGIRPDIDRAIKRKRCAILDISTNIETDHKNGKHDDLHMLDLSGQRIEDFQPLCKTANDAKRHHCEVCMKTHKRYDAKKLGYSQSFTKGDFNTDSCKGCYWYDPIAFNKEISKSFIKTR